MIKEKIKQIIVETFPEFIGEDFSIEFPPAGLGDYASNIALKISGKNGKNPMELAGEIVEKVKKHPDFSNIIKKITIEHPGFINIVVQEAVYAEQVFEINKLKNKFADKGKRDNYKVQIEFISANPTGPITLGNGRGGFTGDTLTNVMKSQGLEVEKEYYVNDAGNQVNILAESVLRKYWDLQGLHVPFPDYCYQGDYVIDLASKLKMYNYTLKDAQKIDLIKSKIKDQVLKMMIKDLKRVTKDVMKIDFDNWFSEQSLYDEGLIDKLLEILNKKDLSYEKEGALWMKTTDYGDDKDRVLIKENGERTYFLSDVAYQYNKLVIRGYDKVIHVWGGDHHGYVARLKAAIGIFADVKKVDFILTQMARLIKDGQDLKISKRAGSFVTIEELINEVGLDAARFFFLRHDNNTHMEFDLDLALEKSDKNPVYYVQYAHARICSILKEVENTLGTSHQKIEKINLSERAELDLIKDLIRLPGVLEDIVETYGVHKLPNYVYEVASRFHSFYGNCRVIENDEVNYSRLELIKATKIVIEKSLHLMGISAPEKMMDEKRKPSYLI